MNKDEFSTPSNTPILLLGYNRPELVEKRLAEISNFQLRHLIISIDGSDLSTKSKFESIIENFKSKNRNLDTIEIVLHEKHLGLTKHIVQTISEVFINRPFLIIVEDDVCLSEKFYDNILSGLNLLQKNNKQGLVSGFSPIEISKVSQIANRWRSTIYTPIWGWGCSQGTWSEYKVDITSEDIDYELNSSTTWQNTRKYKKVVWLSRFNKMKKHPDITWDYQMQYVSFKKSFTNLVPISRFSNNEGFEDSRAVHTKGRKPKWLTLGNVDSRPINSEKIMILSEIIMLADSFTYAGDSHFTHFFRKIKKFIMK